MKMRTSVFEIEEKDRLSDQIHRLRLERHSYLDAYEEEIFNQKKLQKEKKEFADDEKYRLFLLLLPTLVMLFLMRNIINMWSDPAVNPMKLAFSGVPGIPVLVFLAIVCIPGWIKFIRLHIRNAKRKKELYYERTLSASKMKETSYQEKIDACDAKLRELTIQYKQIEEEWIENRKKQNAPNTDGIKLSIREMPSDEKLEEKKREWEKTVAQIEANIADEEQYIQSLQKQERELHKQYKNAKRVMTQIAVALLAVICISLCPFVKMTWLFAGIAYILIVVLVYLYVKHYEKVFTMYVYQKKPTRYKSHARKLELVNYEDEIQKAAKRLREQKHKLELAKAFDFTTNTGF
ncbi:MAG: hypothetical protein Q4D54_10915 [Eubacteriales bacterium]|nr:hypothetical protein [Lachnospiraceae bacterium]MDO5128233.1 hypothetical protein [Eubacteriales bacterium]